MTKNTPKKPAVTVRAINFPASRSGESERRPSAYMAGIAETKRIPRPPAAINIGSEIWFHNHELEVLTGGRGLNGTVLFGSEGATQKLTEDCVFWDGLGQRFYDRITKDCLKRAEVDEHQASRLVE